MARLRRINDELVTEKRVKELASKKEIVITDSTGQWMKEVLHGFERYAKEGWVGEGYYDAIDDADLKKNEIKCQSEGNDTDATSVAFVITKVNFLDMIADLAERDIVAARAFVKEANRASSPAIEQGPEKTGGIDLNPGNMDLRTNYGGERIRCRCPISRWKISKSTGWSRLLSMWRQSPTCRFWPRA